MSAPFIWFDLSTADSAEAAEFYRQLFGWDIADAGVGGYRAWIGAGPQPWAGIIDAPPKTAGQWLPYVVVEDLDRVAKQAVTLGATVVSEASDGPAGTSVTIADPSGARLALFKPFPTGRWSTLGAAAGPALRPVATPRRSAPAPAM